MLLLYHWSAKLLLILENSQNYWYWRGGFPYWSAFVVCEWNAEVGSLFLVPNAGGWWGWEARNDITYGFLNNAENLSPESVTHCQFRPENKPYPPPRKMTLFLEVPNQRGKSRCTRYFCYGNSRITVLYISTFLYSCIKNINLSFIDYVCVLHKWNIFRFR